NKDNIVKILLQREALGSTGIGNGIAIPHGKSDKVKKLVAAFGISKQGVDFESLDGEPVYIFFLLVAPIDSAGPHLKALARISRLLKDKSFRNTLKAAKTKEELVEIITKEDQRRQ
ncbi:PTS sugar transporter subunit IIA, partial [Patescibacteria group bacterium]|nr:PTS sugar transporter subunit IIA [Patescibacteria group bacterium]